MNPPILRLPEELVLLIIKFAATTEHKSNGQFSNKTLTQVALVCRRFNTIATPLTYHTIFSSTYSSTSKAQALHQKLESNPYFGKCCRVFHFRIPPKSEDTDAPKDPVERLKCYLQVVCKLPNVTTLHMDSATRDPRLIRALMKFMPRVETLVCSGAYPFWSRLVRDELQRLKLPNLRHIKYSGPCGGRKEFDPEPLIAPENTRTSEITSIDLHLYCEGSPTGLRQFLLWPKQLVEFSMGWIYNPEWQITYQLLHSMLLPHASTLRKILLGDHTSTRGDLFRAADFPHLEELSLSRWHLDSNLDKPDADADAILVPSLRTFTLDFDIGDPQTSAPWDAFGPKEAAWLSRLVQKAIDRQTALRRIEISFIPESWASSLEQGYPWDRMDEVRDSVCAKGGIDLEYRTPVVTREEWYQSFEK